MNCFKAAVASSLDLKRSFLASMFCRTKITKFGGLVNKDHMSLKWFFPSLSLQTYKVNLQGFYVGLIWVYFTSQCCDVWIRSMTLQSFITRHQKKEGGQGWNIFNIKKIQINSFALHPHSFSGLLVTQSSSEATDNLVF